MFGKIYNQFKGKANDAVNFLRKTKDGIAKGALNHPDVGDIDVVWGNENMGLQHILNKHPEVADNLQNLLDGMEIVQQSDNRVVLESETHRAIISKDWKGEPMDNWLLTTYNKKGVSGGSIDIGPEPTGGEQNGTAPLQDTLSGNKVTENIGTSQGISVKVDEKGVKLYEQGTPMDDAIADIQTDGFDVNETADLAISEAQEAMSKIKKPKTRAEMVRNAGKKAELTNTIDYYTNLKKRYAEQLAAEKALKDAERIAERAKKGVTSQRHGKNADEKRAERITQLKERYGDDFDDDFTKAQTAEELASMYVGRGRLLSRESISRELGYKVGGIGHPLESMLAKSGEGMTTWDIAHAAYESDENPTTGDGGKMFSDKQIHDALISVFQSARTKADIMDFAINAREERAKILQEERSRQEEEARLSGEEERITLTDDDIKRINSELPFEMPTDEDIPESHISQLLRTARELMKEEGTPNIEVIDTERMGNDSWRKMAESYYDGAFLDDKEIEEFKQMCLEEGIFFNEETGKITVMRVFSENVTPEQLKEAVELYKQYKDGLIHNKERRDEAETPLATGFGQGIRREDETEASKPATERPRENIPEPDDLRASDLEARISEVEDSQREKDTPNGKRYEQDYIIDGKHKVTKVALTEKYGEDTANRMVS